MLSTSGSAYTDKASGAIPAAVTLRLNSSDVSSRLGTTLFGVVVAVTVAIVSIGPQGVSLMKYGAFTKRLLTREAACAPPCPPIAPYIIADAPDAVQLSTLHASKGLEFKHVFLIGVEEGVLPHRESMEPAKLEEERRLMYVGITRAQRSLHISYAERRKQGRDFFPCEPSRFIAEMGEDLRFSGGKSDTPPDKASASARLAAMKAMLSGKSA